MGLAIVQQLLAKLYTDRDLRKSFFERPQLIGQQLGLTFEEIQQLSQLSSQQVNLFASSLKHKRLGGVRKLLPLTARYFKKDFYELFDRYSQKLRSTGIKKHRQDAICFCNFLLEQITIQSTRSPWILDVIKYEKSWLQATEFQHIFSWCYFQHAIEPLIESIQRSEFTPILIKKPCIAIWFKLSRHEKLTYLIF
ncbi:MAG: hypothetical protein ACRC11_12840 [Xenococcaceae cyanobacterium]